MGRPFKCRWCRGVRTRAKGFRQTTSLVPRRLRYCNDCKRKFTVGLKRLPGSPLAGAAHPVVDDH